MKVDFCFCSMLLWKVGVKIYDDGTIWMSDNKNNKKNTYELLLSYTNLCCFAYCYFQLIFYDYDDLIYCPFIYIYIRRNDKLLSTKFSFVCMIMWLFFYAIRYKKRFAETTRDICSKNLYIHEIISIFS